ncbi:MAG: N-acetyltransferase [Firmicutes bacterium HGW-Firmicutes-2]|jgi:N-acetylglutamate synthase-like GNAT family acetyltransferase|nr:MAG: N-acetyltransferase [Firmicutes bacterium HGW-Firmicutes-2]
MIQVKYRVLKLDECDRISEINPEQYIKNAWRDVDGEKKLVEIDYLETGWPDGYERYRNELESIISNNGIAFGAFDEYNKLIGFASLKRNEFGVDSKYVLLDSIFVSKEARGNKIGNQLFEMCINKGREWGMDKIYICAGSAEDTIGFYNSLGCSNAVEINEELYLQDTRDIQMEYKL